MRKVIIFTINLIIISLLMMCSDDNNIGVVTEIYSGESSVKSPKWTPDGERVLFTDGGALYFIDSDGSNLTEIPMINKNEDELVIYSCSISNDGRYIAFSAVEINRGLSEIYLISSEGGEPVKLVEAGEDDNYHSPVWSYDDEWIYFLRSYDLSIWRIRPDGTDMSSIDIFSVSNPFYSIKCSNDGRYILLEYFDDINKKNDMLIGAIDNSEEWEVVDDRYFSSDEKDPCYSPDDRWVCFSDGFELFIVSSDGSGVPVKITEHDFGGCARPDCYLDMMPDWSPDGQYIVFTTTGDCISSVKVPDEFLP